MSVQSKMTDIADATRKLSGASGLLDLDEIIFHQEHVGTSLDEQGRDIFNAALSLASAGFGDPIYDPDYELRDNNTIYKQADAVEHVEAQAETALEAVEDMGDLVGGMQIVDAPRIMTAMGGLIGDANTKTGQSDATLTAAVQRLIAGYGGGGGSGLQVLKTGSFTQVSDQTSVTVNVSGVTWADVKLIICQVSDYAAAAESVSGSNGVVGTSIIYFGQYEDESSAGLLLRANLLERFYLNTNSWQQAVPGGASYASGIDTENNTIKFGAGSATGRYNSGLTYNWTIYG